MSHIPNTHRALIDRERIRLQRDEIGLNMFIEVTIVIFALLIVVLVVVTYIPALSILISVIGGIAVCTLIGLIYLLIILNRYKRDLNDHVYEVHGKMIKKGTLSTDHRISVGRQTFRVTQANPSLWDFFLKHADGEQVSVYYSPRTKTVWSIKERT